MQVALVNLTKSIPVGVFLLAIMPSAFAVDITDEYESGDTLTAQKMNNIKAAVNSKQNRISGACPADQAIAQVNTDGTVECRAVTTTNATTLEGIAAAGFVKSDQGCEAGTVTGFDDSGQVQCAILSNEDKQNRISGACSEGQAIAQVNVDGTVECRALSAANASTLEGIAAAGFVKSAQDCEAGTVIGFDETGQVKCAAANDEDKQNRVSGTCQAGEIITAINEDGSVSCAGGGAGSDFNADRLDGFESTDFASSDQNCAGGLVKGVDNQGDLVCAEEVYFLANFGPTSLSTQEGINHIHNAAVTVIDNIGDAFDGGTGTFTAPEDGTYMLSGNLSLQEPSNMFASTTIRFSVVAGGRRYAQANYVAAGPSDGLMNYHFSAVARLTAGETAYIEYRLDGRVRGNGYDLFGDESSDTLGPSYFSGTRLH